jgi:hypothetical protein
LKNLKYFLFVVTCDETDVNRSSVKPCLREIRQSTIQTAHTPLSRQTVGAGVVGSRFETALPYLESEHGVDTFGSGEQPTCLHSIVFTSCRPMRGGRTDTHQRWAHVRAAHTQYEKRLDSAYSWFLQKKYIQIKYSICSRFKLSQSKRLQIRVQ